MAISSVKQFNSAIQEFQKAGSTSGKKLSKTEAEKALRHLDGNGKVSTSELKAAKDVLAKATMTDGAREVLQAFVAQHERSGGGDDGKLSPSTASAILAKFNSLNTRGTVNWQSSLPLGPRMFREELMRERHPDGFAYSVLIPTGGLRPGSPQTDPDKATQFFIERSGGFAGMTQYAGPFPMPKAGRGGLGALVDARTGGLDSGISPRRHVGGSDSGGGGGRFVGGGDSGGGSIGRRGGGGRSVGGGDSGWGGGRFVGGGGSGGGGWGGGGAGGIGS
ncbi:MAG: hypothetical protein AB2A00_01875 [Myxococcota bacterium]